MEQSHVPNSSLNPTVVSSLISRLQMGDEPAADELKGMLTPGMRWLAKRHNAPTDVEGLVQQVWSEAVREIGNGRITDAKQLLAHVRVELKVRSTGVPPAANIPSTPQFSNVLNGLSETNQEVLSRFYVSGQTETTICSAMNITLEQCRNIRHMTRALFFGSLAPQKRPATSGSAPARDQAVGE